VRIKLRLKGFLLPLAGLLATSVALDWVAGIEATSIKIIGSNTVTPLTSVWAEEFMKTHPEVQIAVSGPGSGVGHCRTH